MQLFYVLLFMTAALAVAAFNMEFPSINGLLCIKDAFVETRYESQTRCAFNCLHRQNCQAFTTVDGPCQLFLFDKCSKNVRDCNCTRRGQVFVKPQAGLPSGALCPSSYTDNVCGTKYKAYKGYVTWDAYKAKVESEPGLVIMADFADDSEFAFVKSLFSKYGMSTTFAGGRQLPGSAEPAGGWQWASCNTSISSSMWEPGEPNNSGNEKIVLFYSYSKLNDNPETSTAEGWGECLSPFE